jgi:branched-chain amino acid transport system ATP-binding protein
MARLPQPPGFRYDVMTQQAAVMLELDGLSKTFGALQVLERVDLTVAAGEVLGVIGPNGAGKTTLFNIIAGVQQPTGGAVKLSGQVINRMKVWDRCRLGIARTYQIPKPFTHMSVFENVLCAAMHGGGLRGVGAAVKAEEVLAFVHLDHRIASEAGTLSLLDLKRLELAKALASDPKLLLLDEIAGGLTEAECDSLLEIVRVVQARGTTVVWIEHVIHALRRIASRIAVLYGGSIIANGAPDAVLADPRVRQVYLGAGD